MAEIPKIPESPVRTTRTKEVEQTKRKGKPTTDSHHKKDNVKPGKSTHKLDYSSKMTTYQDEEDDYEHVHIMEAEMAQHLRYISDEIIELSTMVTTEMLPGQLHSLMGKLINEQKQLVNFQQEMATSVQQRASDSQLDQQTSRDFSELDVLLSKIHLVSLKLNLHRMKSVDEAQLITDTKVSEKQDHYKMKQAHFKLELTLMHLFPDLMSPDYTPPHVGEYETKQYIESVYYCQQMLVDDLQGLAQQTLLDKEPAYQEQYMKNLNVLINTQQQLVQNLTDLQKQKKGSKLENESSKQDDLPAGEIGKQQLNELELINEQTDLMKDWHRWMECHRGWQEQQPGLFIIILICSVFTVHHIHGRMSGNFIGMSFLKTLYHHRTMHNIVNKFALYELRIFHSQKRFLAEAEMWKKRQEKKMQDYSNVVRYSLQGDPTDLKQSKQDDQTDESNLEGLKISMEKTLLSDKDEESIDLEEPQGPPMSYIPHFPPLQAQSFYGSSSSPRSFSVEHRESIDFEIKDPPMSYYSHFPPLRPPSFYGSSSSPRSFSVEHREVEPLSAREVQEKEKNLRHISIEIDELSTMVTTEMLPGQLHSLMVKFIKEQERLVNFQQEMATSVNQRATDSQLDQQTSRDLSELYVLLSKIHLVSLKLNQHRMKSVDEAQMKTDTKVSEKQHQDKMKKGLSDLECTLRHLGHRLSLNYTPPHVQKCETKRYMTESVYYCQQMLVDDLQGLAQQTLLDKEPAYQEQYMKNLNVLINTQQQLVQNLTDLQKQKKGSKLEKESSKQDDLPAGEVGKQQNELELITEQTDLMKEPSKQDDLPAGEIGKQQLNELELINEQTDLVKDLHRWMECHRGWQEQPPSHFILNVICSVLTVHRIHGRMSRGFHRMFFLETFGYHHMAMHYELNEFALYEERIFHSQERFLDEAEMWKKRQEKEMQDDSNVVRFSLQGDPTDLKQSKQDDQTDESDLEGLKISMEKTLLSDKDEALKKRQEDKTEHMRHISKEINELSNLVTTDTPPQLHSLVEKLIKEQEQLVNFQQEMATSVNQRATDSQLDQQTSRDLSELDVLLSKIHLVSLKLNPHRMKSVDEAQMKTDTKVSETQHQDKMKKAQFTLQETLNNLGIELSRSYGSSSRVQKYDTKLYMTESVSYCQQMLVDDFQELVPQTLLVKKPAYQEQYMKNLNVLINTQQQLVQNLTDLQKQKKGSKLEKASVKQEDLPAGEVGKHQNELELITEQTDLVKDCLQWVQCHRGWQDQHIGHSIFMAVCSVYSVHRIHGRMSHGIDYWKYVMDSVTDFIDMTIYGENEKSVNNEREIMYGQIRFLHKAEVTRTKRQEQASVESGGSPEATIVSDVTDKPIDEDSNLDAAGFTSITQTTQADTQMAIRNETPSHLEEVLNEFNKQTLDISPNEKTDILLQLPYMEVGFFNDRGGILALEKYDVHLYIPHGAIPEGPPQLVYIYVNPDEVVADTVNSEEEQLSPKVQCGPPGLTFEDSVVLSFPHHAESSDWEFTAKMSSDSSESWQALGSSTDGQLVSSKGDKAIFLVNHFSWFALFGRSSGKRRKRVRVGAFGDSLGPECYSLRVYVWKDDKVSEQRVVGFEDRKRSEILDAFRDLKFLKGKGHMQVEMAETIGWNVKPQTNRINEKDVWSYSQNSVTFVVRIEESSSADDILHVNCFQQQEGSNRQGKKIRLNVVPSQTLMTCMRNNNLNQNCVARGPEDVQQVYPATCHTDGSGDNTLHKSMTEVTNTIASTIRRRPCQKVRMFGGLSDQKVNDLCEFLDNQAAGYHGLPLLDYLSGNGYIPPETHKKEVLSTYFSLCSKHNIADQDAVHYLKLVFHELNCTRAAEIIEPGGERTDAESILQFLDNESLTEGDAEICLRDLAKKLGPEWEDLATYLGIINRELTAVRSKGSGRVNSQIFCMLVRWMEGFDSFGEAAFNTLSLNLQRVERNDLVELLKGKVTSILFFNKQNNRQLLMKVNKGSSS
ncbi:uncharacterized protein [Asterias amurensis]|uniref:uncharacterized protein isoform X2 n=1 Tax=Asterias amurensis TaxID=7602 RepID=UPI003AB26271